MALKVYKFRDIMEMENFLRGGIMGGVNIAGGVVGLVGKLLTFTAPAGSHTFVTANRYNDMLLLKDIKTQLEAAIANLKVYSIGGQIAFQHTTAASAVVLSANNEPAKSLLGFDQDTAVTGKLYGVVPGTPPAYINAYMGHDNAHVLVTNE